MSRVDAVLINFFLKLLKYFPEWEFKYKKKLPKFYIIYIWVEDSSSLDAPKLKDALERVDQERKLTEIPS